MKNIILSFFISLFCVSVFAQSEHYPAPMDDITSRAAFNSRRLLSYPPVREADILWEKRIWRVIDTREKMNLAFRYPKLPLFDVMRQAVEDGQLTAYSVEDDAFSIPLSSTEIDKMLNKVDTVEVINPEDMTGTFQIVKNTINPEDVKRYRLKEIWFFDSKRGKMEVRILGIAPLIEEYDDNGNFKYERPLFWIYYPEARPMLAQHQAPNPWNDRSPMSWTDVFDMRQFSSYVIKASNLYDRKLEAYTSGRDLLLESERIEQGVFNFEQDAWQR